MRRVTVFSRLDQPLFELSEAEVLGLSRFEQLNGEHSLTIETTRQLETGQRVLMQDDRGVWREYVVYGIDSLHGSGGKPIGTYYCTWSVQPDLMGTRVSRMPGTEVAVSASEALEAALSGTERWQVGTVTNMNTGGASMYDTDGWDALSILVENWGGEIDATVQAGNGGVTARMVDLYSQMGEQVAKRRFDFGADLKSVRRIIADGPLYCRITPRGKGEETDTGGYGRKITIESVNDGKDYLENTQMVDIAKLPNGSGGWEYPTLEIENHDCETPEELLAWAQSVLEEFTVPKVTYEVDVLQLAREGIDMQGVGLGDAVHVVDRRFGDGLRLSGRVVAMAVDELSGRTDRLTIGYLESGLSGLFGSLDSQIMQLSNIVQNMNGGTMSTAEYLSRLLERLNTEINGEGGYTYITQGQGIRCYNKAVADPTDGTEADSVVEVKGGTIRIANSKTAQGTWDWKTVFVSGHIAANLVTAANLVAGSIGSADGGTYWNLDNDYLKLGPTTLLDDTTVEEFLQTLDATVTGVSVQYRYSDSPTAITGDYTWQDSCPAWVNGKYIWTRTTTTTTAGTTVTNTTCISGAAGPAGQGVTVSSIEYGTSTSATTQPSSWSETAPTVTQGQWLWVRTTYSDGSSTTAQSYAGTDGEDGNSVYVASSTKSGGTTTVVLSDGTTTTTLTIDDGEDGDNGMPGANGYTHIAWATSADGSQGFSTSVSTGKTYVGFYADNTQSDSHRYQDYSWSLIKGADGTDGVGISSVVPQYYLSTSKTTQVNGSWSANEPVWQEGKYIWTRSLITWSDNTTATTTPVLANGINSANENAAKANALIRPYSDGVLVCRSGNSVGALVNADGSFDVVNVTWSNGVPTAGASLASFGEGIELGDGTIGVNIGKLGSVFEIAYNLGGDKALRVAYTPASYSGGYDWKMEMNFMLGFFQAYETGYVRSLATHSYPLVFKDGSRLKHWNGSNRNATSVSALELPDSLTVGARESNSTVGAKSMSVGDMNNVSGSESAAVGYRLIAQGAEQLVVGEMNVASSSPLFIVGNGSSDENIRRNAFTVDDSGNAVLAGRLTQNSDRRLKSHLAYLGRDGYAFIRRLRPAVFMKDGQRHYGFYAQDVQAADPWDTATVEARHTDEGLDFDPLTLDYTALIAPLVAYAQSLEGRIDELERRLSETEGRVGL